MLTIVALMMTKISFIFLVVILVQHSFIYVPSRNNLTMNAKIMFYIALYTCFIEKRFHQQKYITK